MKKYIFITFILISSILYSQELDCTVNVNYEQLDNASKEKVANFANEVQNYMNTSKFSGGEWNWDKIKCSLNIFFSGASEEVNFAAQVVISSQRKIEGTNKYTLILTIMDNMWKFKYERNQAFYFNQTSFDPLTSFLDYYAYIILGFDADSYEPLSGSTYFQKAYEIAILGSSGQYSEGYQLASTSYNKRGLVENLLNAQYQTFRQDFYNYHYNGLDIFEKKPEKAVTNMATLINNLFEIKDKVDRRSPFLKVFFDSKYNEIIEYMKKYPDAKIFDKLKSIDPAHVTKYNEAINK
ncbi:MAG TPA: DUF4835 family protein [Melioribacteraceae bacterium]|nr:DUF4835 family protein [Melioribacteraceae bacterium]